MTTSHMLEAAILEIALLRSALKIEHKKIASLESKINLAKNELRQALAHLNGREVVL